MGDPERAGEFQEKASASMLRSLLVLGIVVLSGMVSSVASAAEAVASAESIGRPVSNFALKDFRGKTHTLSEMDDSKLVVVAFLGTECPLAKLYAPRLVAMAEEYGPRGVAFIGINANCQDSLTEVAAHARLHKIAFPVLKDLGNEVADAMGAERTPEVFVLDADRVIRYRGRIDDHYGVGVQREEATSHDLAQAIDELLAGKPVSHPRTEAVGCIIGRVREVKPDSPVTYSNQIARIFQNRCAECHREGEIAPFSLTNYEETVGWGDMIAEVVKQERMPPWHADPNYGHFSNDRRLSDEEKEQIFTWVRNGSPEGDPSELPEPRQFVTGWQLPREPDEVIAMRDEPFVVPAEGEVRYQYFTVDPGFTEDRWVKMAEILPGNRAVVHHVIVFVKSPDGSDQRTFGLRGEQFLVAYVPGLVTTPLPEGMAKFIRAGSQFVFQVHYTPIGTEQEDLSRVGLVFADPDEVEHVVLTANAGNRKFTIPPHADNHEVVATTNGYPREVLLLSLSPHMHVRGKSFRYELLHADGSSEILLDVPHYDFNWQTAYRLAEPLALSPGTKVHCVAHFDNSEKNLANPDPSDTVRWGDQTWEEMMLGYFDVALPLAGLAESAAEKELKDAKAEAGEAAAGGKAGVLFRKYDADGSGRITRDEVPAALQPLFNRIDVDMSGHLTPSELRKAVGSLR